MDWILVAFTIHIIYIYFLRTVHRPIQKSDRHIALPQLYKPKTHTIYLKRKRKIRTRTNSSFWLLLLLLLVKVLRRRQEMVESNVVAAHNDKGPSIHSTRNTRDIIKENIHTKMHVPRSKESDKPGPRMRKTKPDHNVKWSGVSEERRNAM